MKGMLTLTIITQRATSLNYGENIGNVSILKKLSLGDNSQITYVSDKALKYDIRRKGKGEKGWKLLDEKVKELIEGSIVQIPKETKGKKKKSEESTKTEMQDVLNVDEFARKLIREYQEFDLFGGLFTKDLFDVPLNERADGIKRSSPVKITYAFSISKFQGDMDFMNNIDAFNRYIKHIKPEESDRQQAIPQSEQHTAHYYYTIAIDLDRIGVWETENGTEDVIPAEEKAGQGGRSQFSRVFKARTTSKANNGQGHKGIRIKSPNKPEGTLAEGKKPNGEQTKATYRDNISRQ